MWRRLMGFIGICLVAVLAIACKNESAAGGDTQSSGKKGGLRIAVIPKGTTHEFWKSVHAGAVKAAEEQGVEVIWKGPLKEDDLKQQIDLVQSFVAQGVDGIVLAPLNDKALAKSVKDASRSKIPVVVIDSALQGEEHKSFVATDNYNAGKLAGERMVRLLGGKGKVVVLRYQEGSASTDSRERGFLDTVKAIDGIEVVSDNQYGGATTESAFAAAESLMLAQKAADGGVDGVFAPNESTTFGVLLALQKAKLTEKVKLVGFDASEKLLAGLRNGDVQALVLQDPFQMGYQGVKTMVAAIKGETIEKEIDTGSKLVDKGNIDSPDIKRLLEPPK